MIRSCPLPEPTYPLTVELGGIDATFVIDRASILETHLAM